jgi:hypothetical protein
VVVRIDYDELAPADNNPAIPKTTCDKASKLPPWCVLGAIAGIKFVVPLRLALAAEEELVAVEVEFARLVELGRSDVVLDESVLLAEAVEFDNL